LVTKLEVKSRAIQIRNRLGLGLAPISDIFSLVEEHNIVLFKRPIENDNISAIYMKDKENCLILINSNKTMGHQIFSAAHELSHFYFDKNILGSICSVENNSTNSEMEKNADLFAAEFLMPEEGVALAAEKRKNKKGKLDIIDIVSLQQYFKVSWIAILWKLKSLGYIDDVELYREIGITNLTKKLEYDVSLVTKTKDVYCSRKYLELVLKCYNNDEISSKRAMEYLADIGFNPDLTIELIAKGEDSD
jgi:Zn-dependent peptidase ImmA (M78 family)